MSTATDIRRLMADASWFTRTEAQDLWRIHLGLAARSGRAADHDIAAFFGAFVDAKDYAEDAAVDAGPRKTILTDYDDETLTKALAAYDHGDDSYGNGLASAIREVLAT